MARLKAIHTAEECSAGLIQAAVVRGFPNVQRFISEGQILGSRTGLSARHVAHALSAAAVLEAGGPKGLRKAT